MKQFPLLIALALVAREASAQSAPPDLWQRQSIYQIITDRFFDGDPSNNNADGNYDPAGHRGISVHGGDFRGIEQKLDYIQALGATAIWISPIVVNVRGEFHGYAGRDFYQVDPHWGTMTDLKHLVQSAHERGLLVIDDIVVNHGGDLVDSDETGYGRFRPPPGGYRLRFRDPAKQYPPPFALDDRNPTLTNLFHNNGLIRDYNNETQVVFGELGGLDDFRTETDYVRARMAEVYQYWIEQAGFDGFRIDTVKHVELGFWQTWCPAIRAFAATHGKPEFFMFGEALDRSDAKCGLYTGTKAGGAFALDSVLDYPLYFKINPVFARAAENNRQLAGHFAALSTCYAPCAQCRLVTFLDNHDQARFLSRDNANNNADRLRVALVFLYTSVGIPCLYYGTEQAFNGANDPYDREDMFAGQFEWGPSSGDNFNMTHPLFQWVAQLNNFRRLYPALQTGAFSVLWSDPNGPGLFAYTRRLSGEEMTIVLNTASVPQTLRGCSSGYPPGTVLTNLLQGDDIIAVLPDGHLPPITVGGASSKLFVAGQGVLQLDPVVMSMTPLHDATNVAPTAPLVLHFSKPMDTSTVASAFSTSPPLRGSFSWSSSHDTMTFSPGGERLPPGATISVHIASFARDAASSKTLHGGFEARFKTGLAGQPMSPKGQGSSEPAPISR